ncbi:NAD(P)-dependent alcohol dehydrogenase [bacterium]|nr:NAD(P)-dependent alcohol dehydrogenase [bacterium]
MQQWQISEWGKLAQTEPKAQELKPGQVRLRIRAISLNYRDHLMLQGQYNPKQPLPLVPCSDGAGEIVEVGPGVNRWKAGERACPLFSQSWISGPPNKERISQTLGGPLPGTLQPELVVSQESLVAIPEHLDWHEAACLPCAAVTAWNAISDLPAGSRVVVQGTGGVSLFALQLAKAAGMEVFITSSSPEKISRALKLGADASLNYRENPDWSRAVRAWSKEGADCVVEVGGAGTLEQSLRCLKPGGKIALIGILAGASKPLNVLPILMQQLRIQGVLVGNRDDFEAMNRVVASSRLQPVLDQRVDYDQAPDAWRRLASGQHFGKVVISGCW